MTIPFVEELGVLWRGIILGVMVAAPVGPTALLCIRRTMQYGVASGLMTGLGAGLADGLFGAIAAFGVVVILNLLSGFEIPIRLIGGGIIAFMAYRIWKALPHVVPQEVSAGNLLRSLISGLTLTATNPIAVFAILAVVTTLGGTLSRVDATNLTVGIFAGSCLWWFLLCGGVALLRDRVTDKTLSVINRVTAVLLGLLAVWAFATGVAGLLMSLP